MPTDFPTQQQMNAFEHFISSIITALPRIGLAVALTAALVCLIVVILTLILRLLDIRRLFGQKSVFLELTPPAFDDKTPFATQKLFSILYELEETRPWLEKLLRQRVVFTPEVPSAREQGIRYVVRVAERDRHEFEKDIASYSPDIRVRVVEDYLPPTLGYRNSKVIDFKLTNHFAYPLRTQESLNEDDPIAYPIGAMTQLAPGEQMVFQIVVSPTKVRATNAIRKKILNNEHLLEHLDGRSKRAFPVQPIFNAINSVLFGITGAVGSAYHGPTNKSYRSYHQETRDKVQIAKRMRPARTLSAFELELVESIHRKVEQPLFRVNIRALIVAQNKQAENERAKGIRNALGSFNVPRYQSLKARYSVPYSMWGRYRFFMFKHRLPAIFNRGCCFLSAAELASLYHFPHSQTAKTEDVVKSLSKTLPTSLAIKNNADNGGFDVMIGSNVHLGRVTPIGLTALERERHLYIIGGTGNGKTTMLFYSILQDIQAGKGIAVIDPHGDLAERILRYIPDARIKDVIYMNPDDLAHPVGVNLLELPEGLTGDDLLREKDLITEATISVLRKIFSEDDSGGHRIEYVLRNSIQTALTLENPTLFTIFELLNNAKFRRKVVKTLTDQNLKDFWDNELGKAGEFQRVKMAAGITAKIGRFLFSASARRVLEQPKSTINFEDIIASKKILICNFSKGMLGEDTSTLFGTTVLAKIQTAALRRARIGEQNRVPFYLYVDEFQNFATMSFVQMLSEARKYKLFLTMAEQSTSQQDQQRLVDIILANVGTIVCFRSGNPTDERLVLPLFSPFINQGEIASLPAYSYYVRIAAVDPQEPMSGVTVVVEDRGSEAIAKRVIASSRLLYAKEITQEKPEAPSEPKGTRSPSKQSDRKQSGELKAVASLK